MITLAVMMLSFALIYLYIFFRTRNAPQLAIVAECIFFASMWIVFEPLYGAFATNRIEFRAAYMAGGIFFCFLIFGLAFTRKLKWRGRDIFELAGESVEEIGDGYTPRPRPVGKVDYSVAQMHGFARYCARHLIALPYITSKNITLVPIKMGGEFGRLLGLSGDYRDATWVNFAADGEVSVHISQKDYLDYRESLAFDQLCASLGQIFIEFMELHSKGEGVRIVDRLDDLQLGIFS